MMPVEVMLLAVGAIVLVTGAFMGGVQWRYLRRVRRRGRLG